MRYALLDHAGASASGHRSPPQDVQRYYEDNEAQYSTPEQVRASHILLKTEGKDDAAVKKQAEDLLAKIEGRRRLRGAREEVLARTTPARSRAATSTSSPRARWCRSSTRSRSRCQPGQISDLVKTTVRLPHHQGDRQEAGEQADAGRSAAADRGPAEVAAGAGRGAAHRRPRSPASMKKPADLDTVAQARAASPSARPASSRATSRSPASAWRRRSRQRAFELKDGEVSERAADAAGLRVHHRDRQAGRRAMPTLDEVKAKRARRRRQEEGGRDRAPEGRGHRRAAEVRRLRRPRPRRPGLEVKTTELIARGAPIGDAGVSPAIEAAAFALPAGGVSDPIVTDNGAVVVKVLEHPAIADADMAKRQGRAPRRAPRRAAQPVLQRLHDQGARADADQRQSADHRADPRLTPARCRGGSAGRAAAPGGRDSGTTRPPPSGSLLTWAGD